GSNNAVSHKDVFGQRPYDEKVASIPLRFIDQLFRVRRARIFYFPTRFAAVNQLNAGFGRRMTAPASHNQLPKLRRRLGGLSLKSRFDGFDFKSRELLIP